VPLCRPYISSQNENNRLKETENLIQHTALSEEEEICAAEKKEILRTPNIRRNVYTLGRIGWKCR